MKADIRRLLALTLSIVLAGTASACNRDAEVDDDVATPPAAESRAEALAVADVELGKSVGADKRINDNADTDDFAPMDTIYAAVETRGAGDNATLTARWTFEDGQVVDETSQPISPTGAAVTEFHISKPDGFPAGNYSVEILLNGRSAEKSDFEVR
jgi:hypothetical protein